MEADAMDFLRFLEGIRTPAGDAIMSALTHLGGETFFLALVLVIYWCVNKRLGYRMLVAAYAGIVCNQFLKLAFRIPRPWALDPNFTIVEAARAGATGYSFPSGHTTNITAIGITLFLHVKRRWQRVLCLLAVALVAFSRMYLGVHTPLDVCAALLITAVIVVAINRLFDVVEKQSGLMYAVLGGVLLLSVAYLMYAGLWKFPSDVDIANLESGRAAACTMLGATLGFILGYYLDSSRIKFSENAPLPAQIIKIIAGLGIIIVIKTLLKSPLNAAFGLYAGQAIRYCIIAVFASAIWPMSFRPIANMFHKR
jgi:membrane-associated phospholipid phosphatase